mgnify:CR=1 FL=1
MLLVFVSEYVLKADEAEKKLHIGYKNRKVIQKQMGKLENTGNEGETNEIWKQICAIVS